MNPRDALAATLQGDDEALLHSIGKAIADPTRFVSPRPPGELFIDWSARAVLTALRSLAAGWTPTVGGCDYCGAADCDADCDEAFSTDDENRTRENALLSAALPSRHTDDENRTAVHPATLIARDRDAARSALEDALTLIHNLRTILLQGGQDAASVRRQAIAALEPIAAALAPQEGEL